MKRTRNTPQTTPKPVANVSESAQINPLDAISAMAVVESMYKQDQMRLAEGAYLPELNMAEAGWIRVTENKTGHDIQDTTRRNIVCAARVMSVFNPLVLYTVELYKGFSVGEGIKLNASQKEKGTNGGKKADKKEKEARETTGGDGRAKTVLENFKDNLKNRCVMSYEGQRNMVGKYVIDGEMPLLLFFPKGGDGSQCFIRTLDPLEINRAICNPEDKSEVWFYERRIVNADGKEVKRYYKDWAWTEGEDVARYVPDAAMIAAYGKNELPDVIKFETAVLYMVKNGAGSRGVSMLSAALPWANAMRRFMENRVSIQASVARYAHKITTAGTSDAIASLKAQLQSGLSSSSDYTETNPASAAGGIFLQNKKVDISAMPQETAADAAKIDGGMLFTMYAIAVRLLPHYVGAGDSYRLATATAMEPPMKKTFLSFQTMWEQVYKEIITYLYRRCGVQKSKQFIRVDFPEIWSQDLPALIDSLARLFQSAPWLMEIDEIVKVTLMHLGIEDPEELWDRVKSRVMGRIEEMNTNRVIGPNGGATNAGAQDDPRTPRPGGKKSANPDKDKAKAKTPTQEDV